MYTIWMVCRFPPSSQPISAFAHFDDTTNLRLMPINSQIFKLRICFISICDWNTTIKISLAENIKLSIFWRNFCLFFYAPMTYSPFHKTLPKSSLQMHWISVRFYEMGVMYSNVYNSLPFFTVQVHGKSEIKTGAELFHTLIYIFIYPSLSITFKRRVRTERIHGTNCNTENNLPFPVQENR